MARRKKQNEDEASQDNNQDNINNGDADDTFGLPEVEYEPIKRDEPVHQEPVEDTPSYSYQEESQPVDEPVEETVYESQEEISTIEESYDEQPEEQPQEYHSRYAYMEETKQPLWPKILAIVLFILVAGSAIYYFAYYQPKKKKQEEKIANELAIKKKQDEDAAAQRRLEEEQRLRDEEQRRADSLASIKTEGSIERLSGRTGQYWVIVASAIDDDLLMDFAQKLAKDGRQVTIIPPFGKQRRFHRLAIEAKDNYEDAQATADGLKGGEFGDQLWVVRY